MSAVSISVNEWDNEYARLARIASQLRSISTSTTSTTTSPTASADAQQLSLHLQRLDQHLQSLPVSPPEIQRRRRLIQHLQQGTTTSASAGISSPSNTNTTANTGYYAGVGPQGSQMAMAMRQQDDMIDHLAVGVGRLRDQTLLIGEEAQLHNQLLSDMEGHLDLAHAGLEAETRRAAQLKEDQSVWRLQLILAGQSVLLVLLILLGLS